MYKPSTYLQLPIFLPICLHMRAISYSSVTKVKPSHIPSRCFLLYLEVFLQSIKSCEAFQKTKCLRVCKCGCSVFWNASQCLGFRVFSHDIWQVPLGYPVGIMRKKINKKSCQFLHSIMPLEHGSSESKHPLALP